MVEEIEKIDQSKIDVEGLIKDFRVKNKENFVAYLKEIWKDLSSRSNDNIKGINKITFSKYYDLPGIISERLFKLFDRNKRSSLGFSEFETGMLILFTEGYEKLTKFIFDFYDFDKDGKISKEDIRVVLSYIPLINKIKKNQKDGRMTPEINYEDRVESQDEIFNLLEECFSGKKLMTYPDFRGVIENKRSELFLYIIIFLLEKKPFTNKSLSDYQPRNNNYLTPMIEKKNLIASPNLKSKFSPSISIRKSPFMQQRQISIINDLNNLKNKNQLKAMCEPKSFLLKFAKNDTKSKTQKEETKFNNKSTKSVVVKIQNLEKIRPRKKEKIMIKKSESSRADKTPNNDMYELEITPARKISQNKELSGFQTFDANLPNLIEPTLTLTLNSIDTGRTIEQNLTENDDGVKFEGFLLRLIENNQLIRNYYKLFDKDLYFFNNFNEKQHQGFFNLSGVFIKEEAPVMINNFKLFCFSIIYPNHRKMYFCENEEEFKKWVKTIQQVTDYADLNEIYEIKDKIGNGRFGIVRLGVHKETGKEVAIKILSKRQMQPNDLELIRTEIEILKICQHPYIVTLYNVFENFEYVYLIMEYCPGGDLFNYVSSKNFTIPEIFAGQIIHKLSTAVFYLHQYGVAHRDLKLENILIFTQDDKFDIKLLDFGLSKIIGPNESSDEPFGTISYVSPEVLLKRPHDKSVDLWSIGIIAYILLCGYFPFDDENNENEIARQTIHDPTPFPRSLWDKISVEAKSFVDNLLQKDPTKRMKIEEVLKHPWIIKVTSTRVNELRKRTIEANANVFKIFSSTQIEK